MQIMQNHSSLLSPAPNRTKNAAPIHALHNLGPTGTASQNLYGGDHSSNDATFREGFGARKLFYSPPSNNPNHSSNVGNSSSGGSRGHTSVYRATCRKQLTSVTKGGTKIYQNRLEEIVEEPTGYNHQNSLNTHGFQLPNNPLDSNVVPLDHQIGADFMEGPGSGKLRASIVEFDLTFDEQNNQSNGGNHTSLN
jgi:hypothetical protein